MCTSFNFKRRTLKLGASSGFIGMYFRGRGISTTVFSGLVSFEDISEISVEGPLKYSRVTAAA